MIKTKLAIGIWCAFTILLSSFTITYAIEGQFEINATVVTGSDTTAPSVPTGLTATAVSISQINLSWTVSTDNVAVTGYRIYRDNALINTSIATTYSDTGLNPSTAYAYTVSAIDAALNESAQSATSSATTFTTATVATGGGGSGQLQAPVIYDVAVLPNQTGATISWKTTMPTIGNLSWGLTTNYEAGTSGGTLYETNHYVTISGLLSGTTYFYLIEAINGYGVRSTLGNQSFTTLSLPEGTPNPTNFTATARQSDIALSWKNPTNPAFEEVRLVRSTNFFPTDPYDGEITYEGRNVGVIDSRVVPGTTYYYALFAKDANGTYSSGSLAQARIRLPGEPEITIGDILDNLPKAPSVHPLIEALSFLDFDFIQNGKKITSFTNEETVTIDGERNLTVSLDYKKVPEVLKSIVITLSYPTDSTRKFSFLLRVNNEKTAYVATIAPLGESGTYGVNIAIVDYKNQGLKKIVGNLIATAVSGFDRDRNIFLIAIRIIFENSVNIILLLILLIILYKSFEAVLKKRKRIASTQNTSEEQKK